FANRLAGGSRLAFVKEVATSKLFRCQTNSVRDFVHVSFEREDALRRAEAPKRTMRWNVRRHRAAVNANVGTNVWASGVNRSARKHDGRERAISTTIDHEVDLDREEFSVFGDSSLMTR